MDLWEAIKGRRSIRRYRDEPVDRKLILSIINAARYAPSSRNMQPWEFLVVQDRETLRRLSEVHQWAWPLRNAPLAIICLANQELSPRRYLCDVSCAIENMLLAAYAAGLGACWIAVHSMEDNVVEDKVREILSIPKPYRIVAMISVGWPAEEPKPKSLRPLEEIVHWEKFGSKLANI
mgnify:CR=1 FL=1